MRRGSAGAALGLMLLGVLGVPTVHGYRQPTPVTPVVHRLNLEPVSASQARAASLRPVTSHSRHAGERQDSVTHLALAAQLTREQTQTFGLAAVTWRGSSPDIRVQLRVREAGGWQPWTEVGARVDAPDTGSSDARSADGRWGTDPVITSGLSRGIQVRLWTQGGRRPADLQLLLIDGQRRAADAAAAGIGSQGLGAAAAFAAANTPTIVPRSGWGADESLRTGDPKYADTVRMAFVHHTVTSSTYSRAQGPAQVRAVYAYDTLGLGISDLGYNFMVDRFGTIYEGRAGGIERAVIGAHTAGFNEGTFAVAVLGDLQNVRPGTAELSRIVNAVGTVAGWKLGLFHRDPMAPVSLVSSGKYGTSKYEAGQVAKMPYSLIGHGDIGLTACPGKYLRSQLGLIRDIARAYQGAMIWNPSATSAAWSWSATPATGATKLRASTSGAMTGTLKVYSDCSPNPVRTVETIALEAGIIEVPWNGANDAGDPVPPGRYQLELSATAGAGAVPLPVRVTVDIDEAEGAPRGPCETVSRTAVPGTAADAIAQLNPSVIENATAVIAGSEAADYKDASVAAVLARRLKAAYYVVPSSGLPNQLVQSLQQRNISRVVVVARTGRLTGLASALSLAGFSGVTRLDGDSSPSVSIKVMKRGWARGSSAVVVPSGSSAGTLASAGAYASARGWPLLIAPTSAASASSSTPSTTGSSTTSASPAASTSPTSSSSVGATTSVTVSPTNSPTTSPSSNGTNSSSAADSSALRTAWPESATATITGTLLVGVDDKAQAIAGWGWPALTRVKGRTVPTIALSLAKKYGKPTALLVTTDASAARGFGIVAALTGKPVLIVSSAVTTGMTSWIRGSETLSEAVLLGGRIQVSPTVVPDLVAAFDRTVTASPTPSSSDTATSEPGSVPSAFVFRGSGFGHGIGMPQYGAQAQAISGRSAREIIEYYYTGSTVKALDDSSDIRVNVLHQKSSVTFRVRAVDASPDRPSNDIGAPADIVSASSFMSAAGDTFTATAVAGSKPAKLRLQRTDSQGRTTVIGDVQRVVVRWGGTRDSGRAGNQAAYIDIAGPDEGLGDGYGRYRYGTMTVSATEYVDAGKAKVGVEAVNQVRVHDEYLRGIGEVPASWSPAALQAQIIASRGYALSALRGGVRSGCDCHLYDSDQSQIFAGWTREVGYSSGPALRGAVSSVTPTAASPSSSPTAATTSPSSQSPTSSATTSSSSSPSASASTPAPPARELPLPANSMGKRWAQAVLATSPTLSKGLTATVDGKAIASYFYSASAGRTENSEDIWTARLSWARSVPDPWSLDSKVVPQRIRDWQVTISQQQIADFFNLSTVVKVTVVDRTAGGAVRTLRADSLTGASATGSAVTLRKLYGLKSRWLTDISAFGGTSITSSRTPTASPSRSSSTPTATQTPSRTSSGSSASSSSSPTISRTTSPSASASAQPVSITVTSTSRNTIAVGTRFAVKGRLSGAGTGGEVVLYQRQGSGWQRQSVRNVPTRGWWRLALTPPLGSHTYQVRWRAGSRSARSSQFTVTVLAPSVTVASPRAVTRGKNFVITGHVVESPVGATYVLRQLKDNGTWLNRGTRIALTTSGRWAMSVRAPATAGLLTYRVVVMDAAGKVGLRSREFTVVVR